MGTEHDAFFRDLPHLAQAEYLESPAVGQHATVVIHKLMQAAGLFYQFAAGAQKQMVRIGQNYLAFHVIQFFRGQRLYGCLGSHGHEHGRLKGSVRRMQTPPTGLSLFCFFYQFISNSVHEIS